ncbi:MAG: 16S rRNA (cytosine(1402)-N(4))-methyltransferase RsmH [Candidatus Zixiibacteriota bacterium]|nr:MAG: 16S rRNA (cytosine(1402)-N(4))-methyltransferase RsmH [candidate division Zixibacteria bacterium]
MTDRIHKPVLLAEVLALVPATAQLIVDCTIGGGGHAEAILSKLDSEVSLIGFDRDVDALATAKKRLANYGSRVVLIHDSYANLDRHLGVPRIGNVDFALLDLGLSSLQLETSNRGFAFQKPEDSLDLRFDRTSGEPLRVKLASTSTDELKKILREYGEVDNAGRIATAIAAAAREERLQTVADLRETVTPCFRGGKRNQFLAQIWQALRIWVNDELHQLEIGLSKVVECLRPDGVMAVISFHSLEDRMVKEFFRLQENPCTCPRGLPVCVCGRKPVLERITRKAIKPTENEIETNSRARSARLRAARRLAVC